MRIETKKTLLDIHWNLENLPQAHPFACPKFYQICERSRVVGQETGWTPLYFLAIENERVVGMLAAFIKTNSFGEFIFDWTWAQLYQRAGLSYYPKLVCALPFTPVNAPKALAENLDTKKALFKALDQFLFGREDLSSGHALFINREEASVLEELGYFTRQTLQYHFAVESSSFDAFLSSLKARKRKQIKKERRAVVDAGLEIKVHENDFTEDFMSQVYELYLTTIDKKWSQAYLNEDFFQIMAKENPESIVIVAAYKEKRLIAMSYFIKSLDTLYGRYWGARPEEDIPYLHFELSYYQAIEYCIKHNLKVFEAGAQGEQKLLRGFKPVEILSAHKLSLPPVHQLIERHVNMENAYIKDEMRRLEEHLPYKTSGPKT